LFFARVNAGDARCLWQQQAWRWPSWRTPAVAGLSQAESITERNQGKFWTKR
jgi:hypothetical protein